MDSLDQWTRILREHLHKLKLSAKELNEIEENCKSLLELQSICILSISVNIWEAYVQSINC